MNNSTIQKISSADFSPLQQWAGPTFAALSKLFWARQETPIEQTRLKTRDRIANNDDEKARETILNLIRLQIMTIRCKNSV